MPALFSIAYLPPLSYLQKCAEADSIIIESHEHWIKQSYRNRCCIAGPNGKQSLVIPIVHRDLATSPIKDILISFESPWNKIHWKSITSAYRKAPYFEFFEDDFKELFLSPPEKLFDFNMELMKKLFSIFKINTPIQFTTGFEKSVEIMDHRNIIHPKTPVVPETYHQVFADRNGFIGDLSAIDYLFNMGTKIKNLV